jgi:hypothetical protein
MTNARFHVCSSFRSSSFCRIRTFAQPTYFLTHQSAAAKQLFFLEAGGAPGAALQWHCGLAGAEPPAPPHLPRAAGLITAVRAAECEGHLTGQLSLAAAGVIAPQRGRWADITYMRHYMRQYNDIMYDIFETVVTCV